MWNELCSIRNMLKRTLFGLLLILPDVIFAGNPAQKMQAQSMRIVDRLLDFKIEKVSELSLLKLRKEIQKVQWDYNPNLQFPAKIPRRGNLAAAPMSRRTASCHIAQFRVVVKDLPFAANAEEVATVALHEALCAIGYEDTEYQISVVLSYLAEASDNNRNLLINSNMFSWLPGEPWYTKDVLVAGGVSSVGSGGDITAARMKLQAFIAAMLGRTVDDRFGLSLLSMQVEPQKSKGIVEPELQLGSSLNDGINLKILVPVEIWEKHPKERPRLLKQIVDIILSVFQPVFDKDKLEILSRCGNKELLLPKKRILSVERQVPKLRRKFSTICTKAFP